MKRAFASRIIILLIIGHIFWLPNANAYSVLTHQAIIDAVWENSLKPLLLKKYPSATSAQLKEAHAYAYGGALTPDMGYFPFGSTFYTNLVHYVRSGDFINTLILEAADLNEYAFALGALSHYYADKYGHSLGTNRAVPLVYPKTRKHGQTVTYEEDPVAHTRTEFGFDVLQTARGSYATDAYQDFIGFQVATGVLERAFQKTYGLDIHAVFSNLSLSINTLRWSVRSLFPRITKVAWSKKQNEIKAKQPGITARQFKYRMSRKAFYQTYGKEYDRPGLGSRLFSSLITILPKVGPLRTLKFDIPGPEAEKLFIQSFDSVAFHYSSALRSMPDQRLMLPNMDYDTGNMTVPGEYVLADETYETLLIKLQDNQFRFVTPTLRNDVIRFFHHKAYNQERNTEKTKTALQQLLIQK